MSDVKKYGRFARVSISDNPKLGLDQQLLGVTEIPAVATYDSDHEVSGFLVAHGLSWSWVAMSDIREYFFLDEQNSEAALDRSDANPKQQSIYDAAGGRPSEITVKYK